MSAENLSFLSGVNAEYIAHLYAQYLKSPANVDPSWQSFFKDLNDTEVSLLKELHGASWTPMENRKSVNGFDQTSQMAAGTSPASARVVPFTVHTSSAAVQTQAPVATGDIKQAAQDSIRALMLIRAFRARGHLESDLDPLSLRENTRHPELDPAHYGFTSADYTRPIYIGGVLGLEYTTLPEIVKILRETYCGKIGVEFMHLSSPEEKAWIQQRIEEPHNKTEFTSNGKKAILQRLTAAEGFEQYLHKKYTGTKRFGIDGGEALIPAIEQIMKRGGQMGLKEIVIGMAHRGRLNVLGNVMGKPFSTIFAEFQGMSSIPEDILGSGDVKYHMGTSSDRDFDGNTIHLSLTANPSHLEFVNPVVIGKVRAKQVQRKDREAEQVMPLLLHGDAAFAGQGITAETLMISELAGYRVGGTIHIVINNQIGFTTMPKYGRSGPYCTDVAKMLAAPIFHVNGDDPESVVHVSRIATEFRQTFKKDIVIDMFCYRRYGHNEGDEPAFTQPLMYQKIATQDSTRTKYAAQLIAENILTEEESRQIDLDFITEMDAAFEASKAFKPNSADWLKGAWDGLSIAHGEDRRGKTAVSKEQLQFVGERLTTIPPSFDLNKKLVRLFDAKKAMFETGQDFDWGTAEALAYGTLVNDKYSVRLSGQDVGRGTFSHRHAILYDQTTEEKYIPHQHISETQGQFEVHDSPLSEMAVLGYEYGYSLADPMSLTIWEAQFGDFANSAQVMIDQFIASGESKWLRMSGLTLLLPHGYEGQGPEHSSARPERFLQLCAEDNLQVCNITSPANFFHVLRRQMVRDFRKPLIVFTPKSLLRHKLAVSNIEEFTGDSTFHRVLWDHDRDQLVADKKTRKVILCTGKIYYDLLQERRDRKTYDVNILRLEQLYPFPDKALQEELKAFPNAEIVWCQEEPKNQGYWNFVEDNIETVLTNLKHKAGRPKYIGRASAAAPATGVMKRHQIEQLKIVDEALG
ncbi:MAG: 2-oxoglutarate dehydrogenase E1 component [Rhodospirillales bacterium]|nr:2-oxoglutarate dehydrogenase E1 component [Rhodospirillales bacterium]MCB9980208.1 2-oxoglutarate dehydrogenase E1 component [Rhodospirillales bacterium]